MTCRRLLSLLAVVAVLCSCMAVTAHAEESSAWVELLEFSTVDNSGSNLFTVSTTGTISVGTPQGMRCTKVDLLIAHPSGSAPASINLRYNGTLYPLTLVKIDATTTRAFGDNIPDALYANLVLQFNKSGTAAAKYQLLSCRVSAVNAQDFVADADVYVDGAYYSQSTNIVVAGDSTNDNGATVTQVRISVYDWMKYDSLTIWGSALDMPISSIRATIGTKGLPITVSYMDTIAAGQWIELDELESGFTTDDIYSGEDWTYGDSTLIPSGKMLYCITVDLSGVDRTALSDALYVYLTGLYEPVWGYTFNCQYVNGSIVVADTTSASWWTRFTTFMTDLMNGDSTASDDFQDDAAQQGSEMDDLNNQLQDVTKPPVEDIQTDVDDYVDPTELSTVTETLAALTGDSLVVSMFMVVLTIALIAYVLFGKR